MRRKVLVLVIIFLAIGLTATVALADAPATGTVYEGVSVPGIDLGDTRAEVEASVGPPSGCRSNYDPPTMESCSFDVEGGGWVSVLYQGPDGGDATGSPDDIVRNIRWGGEEADGWETTAGINTRLAKYDKQAAVDAYPNAELLYDSAGRLYRLIDPELGIQVTWNHAYIFFTVSMAIFNPYTPPPPPDHLHVSDIEMRATRRSVIADVIIVDDQGNPVQGADVSGFWVYPVNKNSNSNLYFGGATGADGKATFEIGDKARSGEYRITIENVTKEGYVFDRDNSVLVKTFNKSK
jgi:hypothetical protein